MESPVLPVPGIEPPYTAHEAPSLATELGPVGEGRGAQQTAAWWRHPCQDQVLFQEMEGEINSRALLAMPGIEPPRKAHEALALATQLEPLKGVNSANHPNAINRNAVRLRGHPTSDAYEPHRASWPL